MTVAENISLGRIPTGTASCHGAPCDGVPGRSLASSGGPRRCCPVGTLRVGERQIVEIAHIPVASARLLILDEPTAALSHHEAETLFRFIKRLRDQGVAIIYITHRLDEVTMVADRVQVLRDGSTSLLTAVHGYGSTADDRSDDRATHGGGGATFGAHPRDRRRTRPALDGRRVWPTCSVTWTVPVRPGEVVALFGKLGSGAAEVGESAFGLRHLDRGSLEVHGTSRRSTGHLAPSERASGSSRRTGRRVARSPSPREHRRRELALAVTVRDHPRQRRGRRVPAMAGSPFDPLPQ